MWAGPESFAKNVKEGRLPVQGGPRQKPVNIKLGFASDKFSYSVEFGLPTLPQIAFAHDPEIKREAIWLWEKWRPASALVDRHGALVRVRDDNSAWHTMSEKLAPMTVCLLSWPILP